MSSDFGNPLRKFKLVFLGEQSGEFTMTTSRHMQKIVVIFEKSVYYLDNYGLDRTESVLPA